MATHLHKSAAAWGDDYAAGNAEIRRFHATDCFDWHPAAEARYPGAWDPLRPEELAEWKALLSPHVPGNGMLRGLDVLRDPEAIVSITGQQAGAALGPLYTVYKALGARHWAGETARGTGRPAVTLFWVASDDHDLAEVRNAAWLDSGGELHTAALAPEDSGNGAPVSRVPVAPDLARGFLEELGETTLETEFRGGVMEALEVALLAEGADFESQFLSLACRWLLPLGIIPVVPRLGFTRRRAMPLIRREIESFAETNASVRRRGEEIAALGWKPPLHREGNEINVFLDWEGVRAKLTARDGRVTVRHPFKPDDILAEMGTGELTALLEAEPERFSPNAILRPLAQDVIFPTAVYTAGPSELVYHGQIGELYELHGVPRSAVFPRPALALLEPRIERAAEKLGLGNAALAARDRGALEEALREAGRETGETAEVERHLDELSGVLGRLKSHVLETYRDTAVRKAMEKLAGGTEQGAGKLRERIEHHVQTREEGRAAAREKLLAALFPGGTPQERAIGVTAPLLLNYGPGMVEMLRDAIDYRETGVQPVRLKPLATDSGDG